MKDYILKDGTKLTYETVGEGRPILFLHGWAGEHKRYWGHIMPLVANANYMAIGLDQRGTGGSSASMTRPVTQELMIDDVRDFIVGANLKNVTLVGSSQGGQIVMGYIGKYGEDEYLHSAVLVDIAPRNVMDENDPSYVWGQYGGNWKLSEALSGIEAMKTDFDAFFRSFVLGVDPEVAKLPDEEQEQAVQVYFGTVRKDEIVEEYESDLYADHRQAIDTCTVPLAYFYAGSEKAFFTADLENYYGDRVKGLYKAVNFHDDNHLFFWERGEEFSDELLKFLNTIK